ncbi:MAG TPA: ATP-binding protein [Tepidisphaeraceae bacterium]|nr:ATP-binding protein [Tepidisphaeraceae bacterium]
MSTKVLLVDDDVENALLLRTRLLKAGYDVSLASSGPQALSAIERDRPSILVANHNLPLMSGVDLCLQIKAQKDRPFIYVIILTDSEDKSLAAKALDAGADDFIARGCSQTEFLARLRAGERIIRLEASLAERFRLESERNHFKESVAAMEQVLGVVAHELRTPLAGLRSISEFLLMPEAKELAEWDTFLMSMNSEITRMAEMVNSLLEAARLNSGVATWHWGTVKFATVCADALDVVRPLIDQSKLTLSSSCEPDDLEGNGDPEAIRRLIINLVNNAAKHTPSGTVSVYCRKLDIQTIELRVADTGKGISPSIAPRLGEPFALNSGSVGPKHIQGTGLGLAICKGIAAAHGGQMVIESAPGKGTTVIVCLRSDLAAAQTTGQQDHIIQRISA